MNNPEFPEANQNPTQEHDLTPIQEITPRTTEELLNRAKTLYKMYSVDQCRMVIKGIQEYLADPSAENPNATIQRRRFLNTSLEDINLILEFLRDQVEINIFTNFEMLSPETSRISMQVRKSNELYQYTSDGLPRNF